MRNTLGADALRREGRTKSMSHETKRGTFFSVVSWILKRRKKPGYSILEIRSVTDYWHLSPWGSGFAALFLRREEDFGSLEEALPWLESRGMSAEGIPPGKDLGIRKVSDFRFLGKTIVRCAS